MQYTDLKYNVSRETFAKLEAFAAEVLRWQKAINLIAPNTVPDIWHRHIEDSLQVLDLLPKDETHVPIIDLGSGGGFPGMVVACCMQHPIRLIESDQRKCQFLAQTARKLGLGHVEVVNQRIEVYTGPKARLITARALSALPKLIQWSLPLLDTNGEQDAKLIFMKGARYAQEIEDAKQLYDFSYTVQPSRTQAEAGILTLTDIKRKDA